MEAGTLEENTVEEMTTSKRTLEHQLSVQVSVICVDLVFLYFRLLFIQTPTYVTVLVKTRLVRTKTEFNFITTVYRHTQYLSIPSVSSVKC